MLNRAIHKIENCNSLDELKVTWVDFAEEWNQLPEDEAELLIECKDWKKKQLETANDWVVESPILGRVAAEWSPSYPSRAVVGGVIYKQSELTDLLRQGSSRVDLEKIHEVKKQFNGEVIK